MNSRTNEESSFFYGEDNRNRTRNPFEKGYALLATTS